MQSSNVAIIVSLLLACATLMSGCSTTPQAYSKSIGQPVSSSASTTDTVPEEFIVFKETLRLHGAKAWYPKYIPTGYYLASIETTTLVEGQGPMCDLVFAQGKGRIYFRQGSPAGRGYRVVKIEEIPWGTDFANTMNAKERDPDKVFIVYWGPWNLGEISGNVSNAELKKIAASMQVVP